MRNLRKITPNDRFISQKIGNTRFISASVKTARQIGTFRLLNKDEKSISAHFNPKPNIPVQ